MKHLFLIFAISLTAYPQGAPSLSRLSSYRAAPGAGAEFEALQRDTAQMYKTNKSPLTRLAWTSLAGPPTFYISVQIPSLAELNEPTWLSKQGTNAERTGRQMRLSRSAAAVDSRVLVSIPALAWDETPNNEPDAFAVVSIVRVKPGRVAAFTEAAKELQAFTKQMSKAKSLSAHRVRYGGNSYDFHMVAGYASLTDIGTDNVEQLRKLMGETKYANYLKSNSENIESVERHLVRYRSDFSYIAAQ